MAQDLQHFKSGSHCRLNHVQLMIGVMLVRHSLKDDFDLTSLTQKIRDSSEYLCQGDKVPLQTKLFDNYHIHRIY